LWRYDSFLP